ncbi:MAG: DUF2399 domain-containing protein [Herpetosiphonaceae bacterium]|nr:DUF2399 domain-containing protein [Herpetosiphonaceae bacterium]
MATLSELVQTILHTLLDQAEQPERERVVRVRLNSRQHPAYFSERDVGPRRDANQQLQQLAAQGLIRLGWRKWEEHNWLETVDLVAEHAADLYILLRRTPRAEQSQALDQLLAAQRPRAAWQLAFLDFTAAQLAGGRSVAPLKLDDEPWNRDLLLAAQALAALTSPTLERTFSVRVFGNSKRFADLEGALVRVLRQHAEAAAGYGEDSAALLRAHLLDRVPEYVPIAGELRLDSAEKTLDLAPFQPSVALSAATLRGATVSACAASRLITVENSTSFSELSLRRPPHTLIVYTGGFASPTVIGLIRQIRQLYPAIRLQHWGDLDAGGLRILAHLRRELGAVEPLAMDVATFECHQAHAQPLTTNDRAALAQLRALPALHDCAALIDHLLQTGLKLEQEAVEITSS